MPAIFGSLRPPSHAPPSLFINTQFTVNLISWDEQNEDNQPLEQMVSVIKAAPKTSGKLNLGRIVKDKAEGALAERWNKVYRADDDLNEVDISAPLGLLVAVKDEVSKMCVCCPVI